MAVYVEDMVWMARLSWPGWYTVIFYGMLKSIVDLSFSELMPNKYRHTAVDMFSSCLSSSWMRSSSDFSFVIHSASAARSVEFSSLRRRSWRSWTRFYTQTDTGRLRQIQREIQLDTHRNTHTYKFLSGCEKVEKCISQLSWTLHLPTTSQHDSPTGILPRKTTQIYTPTQRLPIRLPHWLVR